MRVHTCGLLTGVVVYESRTMKINTNGKSCGKHALNMLYVMCDCKSVAATAVVANAISHAQLK